MKKLRLREKKYIFEVSKLSACECLQNDVMKPVPENKNKSVRPSVEYTGLYIIQDLCNINANDKEKPYSSDCRGPIDTGT